MLNHISVKARLLLLVCVPLLVLIVTSSIAIDEMGVLRDSASGIYEHRVVPLKEIKQVADAYAVASVDVLHKYRSSIMSAPEAAAQLQQQTALASEVWQNYLSTTLTPEEQQLVDRARPQIAQFQQQLTEYQQRINDGSLLQLGASELNRELYQLADPLSATLDRLMDVQLVEAEKFKTEAAQQYDFFLQLFLTVLVVVLLVLAMLSWMIYRSIQNPLHKLQEAISVVRHQSDLRARAEVFGNDEIAVTAQAFNQTIHVVHQNFTELGEAVFQLAAASEEMSQISQRVSDTASEQEQQATHIATAVSQMSMAIQEVANRASSTSEQAGDVNEKTGQGYQKVTDNVSSIEQLSAIIHSASDVIEQLNQESEQITQVLAVIQNIAGQTNLLALNAAIEAARAGDAGRGFAVVADEVRTLATNTQKATESIRTMIDNLQNSAHEAVSAMTQSAEYANTSVDHAKDAGGVLGAIKSAVGVIVDMNVQISAATEEQTVVADDISKNIAAFSRSIGEITRSASHSAGASSSLATLAARLQQQASSWRV